MTSALFQVVDTADGPFALLADAVDGAVLASGWTDDREAIVARLSPAHRPVAIHDGVTDAATAVADYYAGDLRAIDGVAVRAWGTPLQRSGWDALRRIDPGAPLTYTGLAAALGAPRAVRAAASICARNAPALFVPCHRVLRADGSLGGFAWGVAVKQSLLAREKALAQTVAAGVR